MPEKTTPEEKLLKLIENPNAANIPKKALKKIGFSFSGIKKWFAAIKNIRSKKKIEELLSPGFVNRALLIASIILSIYLVFDFIKARPTLHKIYALESARQLRQTKAGLASLLNLPDYLSQINQRDIFHFKPVKKEEPMLAAKEIFNTLASNIRLVGIIWGKFPQAMIEDKQENKTLLLNPGDEIGKIKIRQILRDRVILGYEDLEMELM